MKSSSRQYRLSFGALYWFLTFKNQQDKYDWLLINYNGNVQEKYKHVHVLMCLSIQLTYQIRKD